MKFNEKLIELRKKQGLSQEELGYKLNVTRQTVSKWELGQTTPEMDKLVELSKLFNISIDELINGPIIQNNSNLINEEQPRPIKEKKGSREKIIKVILVVSLIVVLILIAIKSTTIISEKWKERQEKVAQQELEEKERKEKQQETQEKFYNTIFDTFDQINNQTDQNSKININSFNGIIEIFHGTKKGAHVTTLLDNIVLSNKKQDRKIIVKYQDKETQDETEIKNIKKQMGTFVDYDVTFEYDEQAYINKAIIEKI